MLCPHLHAWLNLDVQQSLLSGSPLLRLDHDHIAFVPTTASLVQDTTKMKKAEESGRVAYRPGTTGMLSAEERAVRQVKGILNKLTPEKFERLLQQLLGVVTTADVLRSTIALVFENAVEQVCLPASGPSLPFFVQCSLAYYACEDAYGASHAVWAAATLSVAQTSNQLLCFMSRCLTSLCLAAHVLCDVRRPVPRAK